MADKHGEVPPFPLLDPCQILAAWGQVSLSVLRLAESGKGGKNFRPRQKVRKFEATKVQRIALDS